MLGAGGRETGGAPFDAADENQAMPMGGGMPMQSAASSPSATAGDFDAFEDDIPF